MTAFDTPRSRPDAWTPARPDATGYSTPDLSAARRIRIHVTRTRVIETRTVPLAAGPARDPALTRAPAASPDRPSAFARSRLLAALRDGAGLAIIFAGGYLCLLVA